VEAKSCLGIYIGNNSATAAVVSSRGGGFSVLTAFTVRAGAGEVSAAGESQEETEDAQFEGAEGGGGDSERSGDREDVLRMLGRRLSESGVKYEDACSAIEAGLYTQHNISSELTDYRQISQTIEFDAEEAIATDVTNLAVAFNITGADENGSKLSVFSAEKKRMFETLNGLKGIGVDPVAIEPDSVCLGRFLGRNLRQSVEKVLYMVIGERACHIVYRPGGEYSPLTRNFLIDPDRPDDAGVKRQLLMTIASSGMEVETVCCANLRSGIDDRRLVEEAGYDYKKLDLFETAEGGRAFAGQADADGFAFALGAALGEFVREKRTDFRRGFAPYLGRKKVLQKLFAVMSIAVTVMMVSAAVFFHLKILRASSYTSRLEERMQNQYSAVMLGSKLRSKEPVHKALGRKLRELERLERGIIGDEQSTSAKLTYLFEAINNTPGNVDLNIQEISITASTIRIRGDTSTRSQTLAFFKQIDAHPKLKRLNEILKQTNRDNFTVNIEIN
jgi:hypothetical protein